MPDRFDTPLNDLDRTRYSRQMLYAPIGEAGQKQLATARVAMIGCGGLGTVLADMLVRAGIGHLRIVDRDFVELSNLQRQALFNEQDVNEGLPKAVAAARRLATINSRVTIEPLVADARGDNIENLIESADLVLDGTDNFETRFLINDATVKRHVPWVYGACVGAEGMVLPIRPGHTPCLRCVVEEAPPPGSNLTCDTVGVLASIVHIVASWQIIATLQILTGHIESLCPDLLRIDAWTSTVRRVRVTKGGPLADCLCCQRGIFEFLDDRHEARATQMCGRDAVQITPTVDASIVFADVAARIGPLAKSPPQFNRYLLRFAVDRYEVTLFHDGRAIIKGTHQPDEARAVYAKYVGL